MRYDGLVSKPRQYLGTGGSTPPRDELAEEAAKIRAGWDAARAKPAPQTFVAPRGGVTTLPAGMNPQNAIQQFPITATQQGMQNAYARAQAYQNPYMQQAAQAAMQSYYGTAGGQVWATSTWVSGQGYVSVSTIPKPSPEFMQEYYAELQRAQMARVVEET